MACDLKHFPSLSSFDATFALHDEMREELENFRCDRVESQFEVHKEALSFLESDIENLKQQYFSKEKNVLLLEEKSKTLNDEYKYVKSEHRQLEKVFERTKKETAVLSDDPLTNNDQQKLEKTKNKFTLYETCTGIVFDYSHKETVKGFIQNPKTDYLKTFSLEKNSRVEARLWAEVLKSGKLHCSMHPTQDEKEDKKDKKDKRKVKDKKK